MPVRWPSSAWCCSIGGAVEGCPAQVTPEKIDPNAVVKHMLCSTNREASAWTEGEETSRESRMRMAQNVYPSTAEAGGSSGEYRSECRVGAYVVTLYQTSSRVDAMTDGPWYHKAHEVIDITHYMRAKQSVSLRQHHIHQSIVR
ncbi:hypothetical protein FKP32DRAFT_1607141 [Trametes sanguinea]|nr:hypothetical protein FKP32DRAFT_1607141 [Trametes sanguinea]